MHKIIVKNISYILDSEETLFDDVSFSLDKGCKVGIIGKNGSGKTTLLKILLGQVSQATGEVQVPKNIYYVPQQKDLEDLEVSTLSGGEFVRYHLNQARIRKPDVLLLDEPTNHLDEKGRIELQQFIDSYKGILIFVSHDVDFLKHNALTIFSLWNKSLSIFGGGYTEWKEYFEQYMKGVERQKSALKKEEKKLKEAKLIEHKRHEKVKQKAKKEKHEVSKDKMSKGFFKDNSEFSHGKINAQLEKLQTKNLSNQKMYEFPKDLDVSFLFPSNEDKKSLLIKIDNGNLKIENRELISDYNFEIYYGEKLHLKGENGSGKSVFVKSLINKNIKAEQVFIKEHIKIAYLDQFYTIIDQTKSILENVLKNSSDIQVARKILSLYGFPDTHTVNQMAKNLSGGEMCRLSLAMISVSPLDIIILDEPTNNIDIETKNVLVSSLQKFKGAILLISHDSNFVNELNISKKIFIEGKSLS